VFALILETLSSTELLFILVVALIFFGPRKLPQLARSMGKGIAEFRKASDDFKRTWEREVAIEESKHESENTILPAAEPLDATQTVPDQQPEPMLGPATPESVVARGSAPELFAQPAAAEPLKKAEPVTVAAEATHDPLRKQEWF